MTSRLSPFATPTIGDYVEPQAKLIRKRRVSPLLVVSVMQLTDLGLLTVTGLAALSLLHGQGDLGSPLKDTVVALAAAWTGIGVMFRLGGYRLEALCDQRRQIRFGLLTVLAGTGMFAALLAALFPAHERLTAAILAWLSLASGLLASQRSLVWWLVQRWCADGSIARRLVVVGTPVEAQLVAARLLDPRAPFVRVVGIYNDPCDHVVCEGGPDGYGRSASTVWPRVLAHLLHESRRSDIDGVLIALPEGMPSQVSAICDALHGLVAEIYVAGPSYLDGCARRETLGHVPVGLLVGKPLSKWQEMQKVVFDRVGALLLLLVLMPVLALIAIAIKLDSEGPALFRQKRTGYNNLPFTCFKFRTMYQAAPVRLADGSEALQQTVRGDRRITRVGRFLRSSSLDELPQLLNVLRGEMSLVGPRPHAPNTMAGGRLFSDIVADYARRHRVRPGITGWAQVHGFRGETPDAESLERRVQHDLFYVQNWSLLLDLRILLRTALCILHDPAAF